MGHRTHILPFYDLKVGQSVSPDTIFAASVGRFENVPKFGTVTYLARMVAAGVAGFVVKEQALWQPLLVRRITFAVDGTCVHGERQSPYGELLFHDADTRR